ncbi:MAG: hypothetical protein H8E55_50730 [Pelagibacterales bacterium]|nr:hypothetical protein [Pelagibacterales bacterium]
MSGKLLENRIKQLLSENLKYQKSDLDLMTRIWYDDLKIIRYGRIDEGFTAINMLNLLRDGRLTSWDSATRCRRKIQRKFPQLRDESTYKGRKDKEATMRLRNQFY